MLEEKEIYDIRELFDNLSISIRELSKESKINEVTLARIRDGKPAYPSTVNKLLDTFARVYSRPFYLSKITGVNILVSRQGKAKEAKSEEAA
jgi:predicted transcriptional regulator